jgi:hypothetical protein
MALRIEPGSISGTEAGANAPAKAVPVRADSINAIPIAFLNIFNVSTLMVSFLSQPGSASTTNILV